MIEIFREIFRYKDLVKELISKDIKLKYRRSFLGYLWSVLNPLGIMLVMVIVFSNMFRWDIEYYPVYLIIGQTLFNYMSSATSHSMYCILDNASLLKKIYVPKYIFTLSRITSDMIDFLFSFAAIILVMIVTKTPLSVHILWAPLITLELYLFCIGMGLFLSQLCVFFRDIQYIYAVVLTAWNYLTPVFYPESMLPDWLHFIVVRFNPMFYFIKQMRQALIEGVYPDPKLIISSLVIDVVVLLIGAFSFKKNQDRFILYV